MLPERDAASGMACNYVPTLEDNWSSLSATFPTANRISVLCCRASVIKKDVTSLVPSRKTSSSV